MQCFVQLPKLEQILPKLYRNFTNPNLTLPMSFLLPDVYVFLLELVVRMIVKIEILHQHQLVHNSYLYQNQICHEVAFSIFAPHDSGFFSIFAPKSQWFRSHMSGYFQF